MYIIISHLNNNENYPNTKVHLHVSLIHLQVFLDSNLLNIWVQTDTRSFYLAK